MPVTLAQAALNTDDDLDFTVIDELRRFDNLVLDSMVWDDVVNPTGGDTLTYGYHRLVSPSSAAFRAINSEYVPGKATRQRITSDLKVWGASWELDRVIARLGQTATNEQAFQLSQAIVAVRMKFQESLILGDTAVDANGFDGLAKILTGATTDNTGTVIDVRSVTITSQAAALAALDVIDRWLANIYRPRIGSGPMDGGLPAGRRLILGNTDSIARLAAIMRFGAAFSQTTDDLGRDITSYRGWILADLGDRNDGSGPIIPTGVTGSGETDIYAAGFGMDAVHGASTQGGQLIKTYPPMLDTPGAVKLGEVEMGPGTLVLKTTKAAGKARLRVV
jgi:hypothetical protein